MLTIDEFKKFDRDHPRIWQLFERYCLREIGNPGKIGAKKVMEDVRHSFRKVAGSKKKFRINNSWTSFYVRKFVLKHPHYKKRFNRKKSVADYLTSYDFDDHWRPIWREGGSS